MTVLRKYHCFYSVMRWVVCCPKQTKKSRSILCQMEIHLNKPKNLAPDFCLDGFPILQRISKIDLHILRLFQKGTGSCNQINTIS